MKKHFRTMTIASGLIASAVILAGCSTQGGTAAGTSESPGASTSAEASADFNSADEMFVTMMIPHHEQAVEMADVVLDKNGVDPRVLDLAQQIKDAQGPEIETMRGWLEAWGIEYEDSSMGGMDHGDGMMTDDDMRQLEDAEGAEASRLFLEQMVVHHEGAVEMAEVEVETGQNAEAVALAEQVIEDQTSEIETMQELLEQL
ncbi:DUF305 domain-containing protein [Agrococcus sediminis]|uniref:DUF305 domain-containing protein n=1 Tax=Agrococcus sediminis TaxID=2599924 RepID=A0A5M8QKV1_9MICO|nr:MULTISPECIES: DUF305 domain-containing protein [Agrococcus]KAA6434902.1 DUF305 domain-containing protein [Agrococcus sediminis]RWR25665.1 DUF305 domain-containing protein [Agrococcus lahaulensis]UOV99835.1 DUF305 domain-containing protein [Agrococcus sp. SCSIO52902]